MRLQLGVSARTAMMAALGLEPNAGAIVKFVVMTAGIGYLILAGTQLPAAVYSSMTITQLWTVALGAFLAVAVLGALGRFLRDGDSSR